MNHRITIIKDGQSYETFEDILPKGENSKLDMLIVGKTPTPDSVKVGHYFQGRNGKSMWNKLEEYGIITKKTIYHDDSLLDNNIGITDIVKVPRSTGNEPSLFEYLEGKEHIIQIINRYKPKVVFFVYKPVIENLLPFTINANIVYGFNDNLMTNFNGCRPFLFPMPGTGKVTKEIIHKTMTELKVFLTSTRND